jgi:hypothetical protein
MTEELVPSFSIGQHHVDKKRKAKGGLLLKGWDRTEARIGKKEETTPKVTKLSIQEKKGAEHLTTHPRGFFLG